MSSTEKLSYAALFVLGISLLLTNQVALATVAIVPFVLASFKYSFPKQAPKDSRHHWINVQHLIEQLFVTARNVKQTMIKIKSTKER